MLKLLKKIPTTNYVVPKLNNKAALGQYMTPAKIATFMASFFPNTGGELHLLDAGAGEGSLTCAFLDAWKNGALNFSHGEVSLFELDSLLTPTLDKKTSMFLNMLPVKRYIYQEDFIQYAGKLISEEQRLFTHVILNPPYKKISSKSKERLLLRSAGIEVVNLYAAFVALSVALLKPKGHLVAIIPRSFCNGPYYKPFREFIMRHAALQRIHLYDSRTEVFKEDGVLQENVIIHLEKDIVQGKVTISTSRNADMNEYNSIQYPFEKVVVPTDSEKFIRIPDNNIEDSFLPRANHSLTALGINVSTGPVVDFRLKSYLRNMPINEDAPLLYPGHFNGKTEWPKLGFKKPNAIQCCEDTMKWLYPNGFYVVVRRLSSKEEKRRIVANIIDPDFFPDRKFLGFENHFNVFHCSKSGMPEYLAYGLALYLNSPFVDKAFRRFNGHTQVNATDLRALPYLPVKPLLRLAVGPKSTNHSLWT